MNDAELDEIEARCLASTTGPWEWRDGVHTEDVKTSEAGGIHTQSPVMRVTPDGRPFDDDNVVFPIAKIGGHPYWLEKFFRAVNEGKRPLSIALELFARQEDKAFILTSRGDVLKLVAEVRRLRRADDAVADRLRAENERLRAALQDIADYYPGRPDEQDFRIIQGIAEEALKRD